MTIQYSGIKKIAKQIEKKWHPQKIILFGSYAYGKPTKNSDVDLLIILNTKRRNIHQAFKISRSISHPFPLDILVIKPKEVLKRLKGGDLVLREMIDKGKTLYEISH